MPNVVLLVLDTVRAGHLGCYGYARRTSPAIDAFATDATRYACARATAPWTLPSHASMFTGRFPFEHGAHRYKGSFLLHLAKIHSKPLPERWPTLAEALRAEGYATGGFTANSGYTARRYALCQGFDTYEVDRQPAVMLNGRVFRWLDGQKGNPFFLFVNYMDAHYPYNTTPRPGLLDVPPLPGKKPFNKLSEHVMPGGSAPLPSELVQCVTDQYDTGIANADLAVGELLNALRDLGVYDQTMVIVASDMANIWENITWWATARTCTKKRCTCRC